MSRKGRVYNCGVLAGILEECAEGYRFTYDRAYLAEPQTRPISATLPKSPQPFTSGALFPFFFGLLAEGPLKQIQCRLLKLDQNDHFGRLLRTAHGDVIGSVKIVEDTSP